MKLPRPVRAVVFDMDGLLCDTEVIFRDAIIDAARDFDREMPVNVFLSMIGTTDTASRQIVLNHFGAGFPIDEYWNAISVRARSAFERGVPLNPASSNYSIISTSPRCRARSAHRRVRPPWNLISAPAASSHASMRSSRAGTTSKASRILSPTSPPPRA